MLGDHLLGSRASDVNVVHQRNFIESSTTFVVSHPIYIRSA